MTQPVRPRAVGLNHVALEVGDIEEALAFYACTAAAEINRRKQNE